MNTLLKRSFTGLIFLAVMISGIVIHPIGFTIIFGLILFFTQTEFYKISEQAGFRPQKNVGRILGVLFFILCSLTVNNLISSAFILFCIPFLFFVFIAELFRKNSNSLKNGAITIAGLIYVAFPFGLLNFIVSSGTPGNKSFYPWILMGLFLIIWVYDSMAYVTGSLLGKHKIAAKISPGKSWEGLIGGSVFAVIMGIVNAVLFQELNMINWIIIALFAVIFGTFGDFFESKLKRESGIKDSGNILPGHGGLLDRFDSLLFVAPVVFVWLNFIDKF